MVVHAAIQAFQELRQKGICKFKASLDYAVNSRLTEIQSKTLSQKLFNSFKIALTGDRCFPC